MTTPIYRLTSKTSHACDEGGIPYKIQYLMSNVKIPDTLKPGDVIHLEFDVALPSKEEGIYIAKGGCLLNIDKDGDLEFNN